ncbi:DUF6370 family protein [Flavobacterium sp. M31R6]|uniref:DUF6370 family protein n=1 Tax=Flavobacterium sp. M31R6 TaxID=2739062 RepID=UPI001568C3B3|nr:DUF6370 family protein [Flavobacterium sp. M31R6]QKJ62560.1 hypothetical protein HQN62_05240 [Flavobacterium sp. M31R6]
MKNLFTIVLLFIALISGAQEKKELLKSQIVEVSCGQCQFGLKGKGCDLAVRIDGKSYFVDGTKIDDHGDADAKDGFCKTIRKAEVAGTIVNNRFKVTSFTLLPEQK